MYSKIILFILLPLFAFSQAPNKINFQSVIRNNLGEVQSNKSISLKISILSGSISGLSVYSEIHTKTTDISGLISLQIGNGTILSGIIAVSIKLAVLLAIAGNSLIHETIFRLATHFGPN